MNAFAMQKTYEVLLVEDSITDTRMVRMALDEGQEIRKKNLTSVLDGELAMEYLRSHKDSLPDLILLDLNLPKKDGWEVLAECKSDEQLKSVPIVVFTTSQLDKDVHRCYQLGANSFIAKPFELHLFLKTIRDIENYWLGISASHRA
jgi:CheY-like chemotaxis protein